ncbi:MAG: response regulator transcription factor [Campylobacterota bacterium]|nr:response regulator transcription factor [Campylobacterota bacterium]
MEQLNYTLLFVEDEIEIRHNFVLYLKHFFKAVYEAGNGKEAYGIYKDKKPDIIIIDINLPSMSGLELLSKIRQDDHSTRALMLTAHADSEYLLRATELKLTKYLLKPISRAELKEALELTIEELQHFTTTSNKITHFKECCYWNHKNQELYRDEKPITITPIERKILRLFFDNVNQTLGYDDIIIDVWDEYEEDKHNALKNVIRKLRTKLPSETIINVYGEGFKLSI